MISLRHISYVHNTVLDNISICNKIFSIQQFLYFALFLHNTNLAHTLDHYTITIISRIHFITVESTNKVCRMRNYDAP